MLTLYVPAPQSSLSDIIAPGSALVGSAAGERVRIDYEGNIYDRASMHGYATRVLHAAGRHVERYPTRARIWVDAADVQAVGTYDVAQEQVHLTDEQALCAWLCVTELSAADRVAPTRRRAEREAISQALAQGQVAAAVMFAARQGHEDLIPRAWRSLARSVRS